MNKLSKYFLIFLLITISYILQTSLLKFLPIFDNGGNLILVFVVCFSFINDTKLAIFTGLFAGIIVDINAGIYMGVYEFIFMYIAYFSSKLGRIFLSNNLNILIIVTGTWELLYNIIVYIFTFLIRQRYYFVDYVVYIMIPDILLTIILVLFAYKPIILFSQKLQNHYKDRYVK